MPAYNEVDDNDAWRDDESMTSTDDFSSHTGDLESIEDSDFEFLSRSSSQVHTEEEGGETDIDDIASVHTTDATASVITGFGTEDASSVVSSNDRADLTDEDAPADSVLQSTELPSVVPETMEDSTSTITQESRQRRDTVTQIPPVDHAPHSFPFNILYAGSSTLKSNVLRKLGQALMAAVLREGPTNQVTPSSINTDWSSGYTSVVPITDFNSSDTVPEVEFVEDSLVKIRVQEISTLQGFTGRGQSQFMTQVDHNTRVISCCHRDRENRSICPWIDSPDNTPSLLVYCYPVRGEKYDFSLQKMEEFAQTHHIPLLTISEWEVSKKRYTYKLNQGNFVSDESGDPAMMLGYDTITPKKFFELDSLQLGISLWKNATASQEAIKSSQKVHFILYLTKAQDVFKLNLQKRLLLRIVAMVLVSLILFLNVPYFSSKSRPIQTYPVANTPTQKELETKFVVPASDLMSIPLSTVTVTATEQLTVTVPVVHTKTVTTSTTVTPQSKSSHRPASTIVLDAITTSINVPRASLIPRQPDIDYGYAFGYDDNIIQMFLETERSVLLRLPRVYRDSITARPRVKIAVLRNGKPIEFELREWKKNDLAFITWPSKDMHDRLEIKVWTESHPLIHETVIIDYTEPIIDPRLWEILEKSQLAAWKKAIKMSGTIDEKVRLFAKEVKDRVSYPANYVVMEEKVEEFMRLAKKLQSDVRDVTGRRYEDVKSKYPRLFTQPMLSDKDIKRFTEYKENVQKRMDEYKENIQKQMDEYVHLARKQALKLSNRMSERSGKSGGKKESWNRVKDWYKPKACGGTSKRCGGGTRWRKFTAGRV